MADIRKLKKHLSGIRATEKLAGAMKTVSTAKFSKLSALNVAFSQYAAACKEIADDAAFKIYGSKNDSKVLYLVFTGNKGLCGGYNSEIAAHLSDLPMNDSKVIVCGKKGYELIRAKGINAEYFETDDIPSYNSAKQLLDKIQTEAASYGNVTLVYRRFVNALVYPIVTEPFYEQSTAKSDCTKTLYVPCKEEIEAPLNKLCLTARLYGVMLQAATGAQAATLMTMRSAADNAKAEAFKTETAINRERQNALTASVIESASGAVEQN